MTHRVFVADDEPALRALMEDALQAEGYDVETFETGEALLERMTRDRPDAVLLDINMPGRSGWDIKAEIDRQLDLDPVPVIAVTARGGPSVERSARDGLGFESFVRKPFRLADLMGALEDAVEVHP